MNQLRENLPLISAILLVVALIHTVLYYYCFGVNIMSFIDLSECLTLSVPFLLAGVAYVLFCAALVYLQSATFVAPTPEEDAKFYQSVTTTTFAQRLLRRDLRRGKGFIILVAAVVFTIGYYWTPMAWLKYVFLVANVWMVSRFVFDILVGEVRIAYFRLNHIPMPYVTSDALGYALFLLVICAGSAFVEAGIAKYRHPENPTIQVVKTKDFTLTSSDTYRYVGKTKSYVVFYNTQTESADVLSLDGLQSINVSTARVTK